MLLFKRIWSRWCTDSGPLFSVVAKIVFRSVLFRFVTRSLLTHWHLELFAEMAFFDILVVLPLDLGQISFSLMENAFATRWLAVLPTRISVSKHSGSGMRRNQNFEIRKWPAASGFSTFEFFFPFPFFPLLFFLLQRLAFYRACLGLNTI